MSPKNTDKIANGKRTPNEVLDAFAPVPITAANIVLRPLTISDFMLLERLDSPFANQQITPDTDISISEIMEAVYILAHPAQTSRSAFARGRPEFDDAVFTFGDSISPGALRDLGARIAEAIHTAFSTLIIPQKKRETQGNNFSGKSATASAGS
jgi:hypothetical protein